MEKQPERDLLKAWTVETPVPTNFNASVWRRIEQKGASSQGSIRNLIAAWFAGVFAKPAFAISYAGVALLLGLAAGHLHGASTLEKHGDQLEARYLQSVDPYAPRALE